MVTFPFQYSNSLFVPFTATVSPGANAAYPVTNLGVREYPFLPWVSASLAQQVITLDMGAPQAITHIVLFHANFVTVTVAHAGSLGGPYTTIGTYTLAPYISEVLPLTRGIIQSSWSDRYIRLTIPSQTVTNFAPAFSLGMVEVLATAMMTTMVENPEQFTSLVVNVPTFTQRIGSHVEAVRAGPRTMVGEISGKWESLVDVKTLLALRPSSFILYRNRNLIHEVFFIRVTSGRYTEGFPLSDGSIAWEEVS